MKKIIYRNQNEIENFDIKRFVKSINKYAKVIRGLLLISKITKIFNDNSPLT